MNSHDRVVAALNFTESDRIPVDFSASGDMLERLMRDLKCGTHRELLERLEVDIVDLRGVVDPVYSGPVPEEKQLPGGITENFWGWRQKKMQTATGDEEQYCDFVLQDCDSVEELAEHTWPSPDWFDFNGFAGRLAEWADLALMASGGSIWQHPSFLRGLDRLLMDMVTAEDMADFLFDKFTDFYVEFFDRMFTSAKGQIDILRIADDLGMQDRLLISPKHFDRYIAPRLKRLTDMAHAHVVKVMFHSCGAIKPLINRIINTGVDILDPLQVTAKGMEPDTLKKEYGDRLCLHGSIDTQYLLPREKPEEVRRTAEKMIRTLGKDGGFILAPCHVLQTDVPTENVLALYRDAVR